MSTLREVDERLQQRLLEVPNMPHPSVPVGRDERENVVIRQERELPGIRLRAGGALGSGPDAGYY